MHAGFCLHLLCSSLAEHLPDTPVPTFLGGMTTHTFPTPDNPSSIVFNHDSMLACQKAALVEYRRLHQMDVE